MKTVLTLVCLAFLYTFTGAHGNRKGPVSKLLRSSQKATTNLPNIGECFARPCKNGGVCSLVGLTDYTCTCPSDKFTGKNCQLTACIKIPWPGFLIRFFPQPFEMECTDPKFACALNNWRPSCECFDPNDCPN